MTTYHFCVSTVDCNDIQDMVAPATCAVVQYPLDYDILLPGCSLKYLIQHDTYQDAKYYPDGNLYLVKNIDPSILTVMRLKNIPVIEFYVTDHELMINFPRSFRIGINDTLRTRLVELVDKHRY